MKKIKKIRNNNIFQKKKNISIKSKIKFYFFISLLIIIFLLTVLIYEFEKNVVPILITIGEKYATNMVSTEIDKSVENTIKELNLFTENFINKSTDKNSNNFLDVNTILINNICLNVSTNLTERLQKINENKLELPLGVFSGFNSLSGIGPKFKVTLSSIGETTTDYETSFEAVGINQINFQVYLIINTKIALINPIYKKDISISRKLMIVNTVFNGEVPNTYLNIEDKKNIP